MNKTISYTRTLDPAGHNLAVASASTFSMISAQAFMITTVHVPRAFRGEKHGSAVLDDLCLRADMDGYELYVDPRSHDASRLTGQDLVEWFERRGFTMFGGILRRLPQRRGAQVDPVSHIKDQARCVTEDAGEHQEVLNALAAHNSGEEE